MDNHQNPASFEEKLQSVQEMIDKIESGTFSLEESVRRAKDYISGALAAMLDLGAGSGPMAHNFALTGSYAEEARE